MREGRGAGLRDSRVPCELPRFGLRSVGPQPVDYEARSVKLSNLEQTDS